MIDIEGVVSPQDFSGYSRTTIEQLAPCPLCAAAQTVETSRENLHITGVTGMKPVTVAYGYCGSCGHIYQVKPAPAEMLEKHYSKFSNYAHARMMLMPSAMTKRLLSITKDYARVGKAYEVGCGAGIHLIHFRAAGWEVAGCDPSPAACEAANRGRANVECGLEADMLPLQHNLDLIIFSGVLEHLTDPVAALKRARAALSDTGKVVVEVPCAASPHMMPPGWFAFEHLHYFTPEALSNALALAGLAVIEARTSYRDFIYPVITVIAEPSPKVYITRGDVANSARLIADYNKRDQRFWAATAEKISKLNGKFYVWGAGVHTSQLIDRVPGCLPSIEMVIDRDGQKHGSHLALKSVTGPSVYMSDREGLPIVISSYANEKEIAAELLGYDVPEALITRLYT